MLYNIEELREMVKRKILKEVVLELINKLPDPQTYEGYTSYAVALPTPSVSLKVEDQYLPPSDSPTSSSIIFKLRGIGVHRQWYLEI